MQYRARTAIFVIAVFALTAVTQAESVAVLFQKGTFTEETVGDLDAAIKIYGQIASRVGSKRSVVALARYRLGICYMKKGARERKEAVAAFEKLIDEFAEQRELVARARARLSELGHGPGSSRGSEMASLRIWEYLGLNESYPQLHSVVSPSPDGRYVAFRDRRTGGLALRNLITGKTDVLHAPQQGTSMSEAPFFSRDGRRIAYNWGTRKAGFELRVIEIETDGTRSPPVYGHESVHNIAPKGWTPQDDSILVRIDRRDGSSQIAMVSVADGSLGPPLKSLAWRGYPQIRLSPDGRYVAYDFPQEENTYEPRDIFLLDTQERRVVPLVTHPGDDALLGWAPDGKRLVFKSPRLRLGDDVWLIDVAGGKARGDAQMIKTKIEARVPVGRGGSRSDRQRLAGSIRRRLQPPLPQPRRRYVS